MEVVAIYFPSWHPHDHYSAWYGPGFTEWELVKSARPIYPGHHQPKVPSWGNFDESDPEWAAREIDLAADHGVTTFLFDWYWYSGVQIMQEALERGFLKAPNRDRLKFALMWANHTWGPWPATTGRPGMGQSVGEGASSWLPIRHSMDDLDRVIDYCCERYFAQSNYWRVRDRPVFSIYDVAAFETQLGGPEAAAAGLERMNDRARSRGLPGLHFLAQVGCCNDNVYCCGWERVPGAARAGFESAFAYNIVRTPGYDALPDERPIVDYADVMESHRVCWGRLEAGGLPHLPVVTLGCDVTPRWHRGLRLPMDFRKLNYEPIIEGNTPERFGDLCGEAIARARAATTDEPRGIVINAWNEWTEGMFLLPEERYGTGYLEALKQALEE